MKDSSGKRHWLGENVTSRGMIFTTFMTSSELSLWHEEIDVVTADVVLGKIDDSRSQTSFSVMVRRVLGDITDKLGDLTVA